MRKNESASRIGAVDNFLLKLDEGGLGALYRVLIGFITIPLIQLLLGSNGSDWRMAPLLLLLLLLLRVLLAAIRKIGSFSPEIREVWSVRRRTAKLYDCYQWRKLLWIGSGLALYIVISGQYRPMQIALSMLCLFAGAGAALKWRAVATDSRFPKPTVRRIKSLTA